MIVNILITGASGLIGTALTNYFQEKEVIVLELKGKES